MRRALRGSRFWLLSVGISFAVCASLNKGFGASYLIASVICLVGIVADRRWSR